MRRRWSARRAAKRHGAILLDERADSRVSGSEGCGRARKARRRGCRGMGAEMGGGQCAESDGSWRREGGGASK